MNRRRVRVITIASIAVVLVVAGVIAAVWQPWRAPVSAEKDSAALTAIAERTTLTSNLIVNGSLSYGDVLTVPDVRGTITRLPKAGDEVSVGQSLLEVEGRPVIALRGDRPFWRDLSAGMTNGADVLQLEQNLSALGFGAHLPVDTKFSAATTTAIKAWQKSLGLERTGVVAAGDVIAISAQSIRVASVTAKLGDQGGSPLTYTSTVLGVVAKLTDAQAREILPATPVTVTLPDGTELTAKVTSTDPGGQPDGNGGTTSASARVDFDDPAAAQGIGLRAVKVKLASASAEDVLVIPVTALVATLDGGYAVDVLRDGKTVRVPVKVGLIADTRVEVTDGELVQGDAVVVVK